MKRLLTLLLSVSMLLAFATTASANGDTVFDFTVDGTEYTVTFKDCDLSYEKMEMIAKVTLGIEEAPQTCAWDACQVLGHNFQEHDQVVTTHKVRAADPRCQEETFGVITCTRCSYMDLYLKKTTRISCCPVE